MKVFQIQDAFGLENLRPAERPNLQPGPGQVLIQVRAAALNYRDLLMVQGHYNPRQPLPLIPVSDGAGEVVAVGDGVARVAPGDRVAVIFAQGWLAGEPVHERIRPTTLGGPNDGTLAEQMVLSEHGVVRLPDHLSFEQAATLPCAALTAWSALARYRPLMAGETVLVQGTGGVSIFALQLAKMMGAKVIVTSSSDAKLTRAKALGADYLINYRDTPDWAKPARDFTGQRGVDRIIEVGGAGTFEQSLKAIRMGGFIATIGVLAGAKAPLSVLPILMSSITVQGIQVGSRDDFESMNRALEANRLEPMIDRVFEFDEVPQAFELLQSGGHFGKIVIRVG